MIDSLSGYLNAMPDEQFMILQMHELLTYLNQQGVVTILILAQSGMVGHVASPLDLTYLSDTVLLLALLRGRWADPPCCLGDQEADRLAREHDPGVLHR